MRRLLAAFVVILLACTTPHQVQGQDGTGIGDRTPAENVSPGRVRERAPSTWITAARQRHQELINARVNAPRGGEQAGTVDGYDVQGGTTTFGTTGVGTGGLSGLLDLVNQFGGVSGLGNLLGGLTGGATTTGYGFDAGTSAGSPTMTIEDLLRLEQQLLGTSGSGSAKESGRAQSYETRDESGAIGRLPKIEPRAQTTSAQPRKFVARWAERMAQTLFTGLALGFQSRDFIDFLKDQLRPVFFPSSVTDGDNDGGSGNQGGGIEDLEPTDGGGGSDSII